MVPQIVSLTQFSSDCVQKLMYTYISLQKLMNPYRINVYKIYWEDCDDIYVGSTRVKLSSRMIQHRNACKQNKMQKINIAIREKGIYDFRYILLGSYTVFCRNEQMKWEQHHIDILKPNLNVYRSYRSKEYTRKYIAQWARDHPETLQKYRDEHKDDRKNYHKMYYKKNKEKITERHMRYVANNKEKITAYRAEWSRKNKNRKDHS